MSGWELVVSFIAGLFVNEMTDVSPWAARKLVRWAAYRWSADPDIAAGYAEEWAAIIEERPGKLLKLFTAAQFTIGAAGRATPRALATFRHNADQYFLSVGIRHGSILRPLYWTAVALSGVVVLLTTISIMGGAEISLDLLLPAGVFLYWVSEVLWRLGNGRKRRVRRRAKPSALD